MLIVKELKYEPIRPIGVGAGMNSTVYEARDELGRTVAVKVIKKAHLDRQLVTDYFAEAKRMSEARHDNVVPIITAASSADEVDLMMPLYRRGSAGDRIQAGPMALKEARRVALGMLQGLASIHVAGILHFDLKPSNVMFGDNDEPLVADFGQSRMIGPLGTAATPPMYQHGFPPEMFNAGEGTPESDIYLAGLTLYRFVNGDPFFYAQLASQLTKFSGDLKACIANGALINSTRFQPHVPTRLRTIIRAALAPEPERRYSTANEMAEVLGQWTTPIDWSMEKIPGGLCWRGIHATRSPVSVEATQDPSTGKWAVVVHTHGDSGLPRAKGKRELWRVGLTSKQLAEYLSRDVFPTL